ncbi:MAG TPA: transcriptional regulator, partial [Aquaticitalea sp.]|nr:transcriptional regulator [Aquaticitalea sp.]
MTSVIIGDIIKSERISDPTLWLDTLKSALTYLTKNSDNWELFRGDSFQIEIADITNSFEAAIYIKAALKSHKSLDARMALGIGNKSFTGKNITESNGEVFQFSGETLEQLKKEKVTFKIKTPNPKLDVELNLYFKLAFTIM